MIYFDNIIFYLQKAGGISAVWQNLIKNILPIVNEVIFLEWTSKNDNLFRAELEIPSHKIVYQQKFNSIFCQLTHPNVRSAKPFIFHSSYFRICKNSNAINVTTVHDFIYEQGKPNLKQKFRMHLNYKSIRNSDAIVCISENTKRDLFKFLPDIDPKKVYVIYNGVSEDYNIIEKDGRYTKYNDSILFVGGRQGYKNFEFVVNSLKESEYKLLICGSPLSEKEIDMLEHSLSGRYENIVFPSNHELNKIYNSVYALAYPSSYEGFGIPVLEAQRAGCPVIALNSSSIPEVIGETPLLMNELSAHEFLGKLRLLKNNKLRHQIIESGLTNSKRFSWSKMATEYLNLYNSLLTERVTAEGLACS